MQLRLMSTVNKLTNIRRLPTRILINDLAASGSAGSRRTLTTEPCDGIRDAEAAKNGFEPWLSGEDRAVDPGIDAAVQLIPVSPKMNSPRYNEPDCIDPLVAQAAMPELGHHP
ncbi:MAG: hypothetical protein WBX25_06445 [Rhodomicrobium sp.]